MIGLKPYRANEEIEPNPFVKDFLSEQRKEHEILMNKLEEAIKEKIYGAVRVYIPIRNHIYIEVYNDRFDFKYAIEEQQIKLHDTEIIVFDFLHKYRKEVLRRYIKEVGGIE